MSIFRFSSVSDPLLVDPGAVTAGIRLVARAQYLGALSFSDEPRDFDRKLLQQVFSGLSQLGVAREANFRFLSAHDAQDVRHILERALEEIEHSPVPSGEWRPLIDVLGESLLSALLGISESSLRRYAAGTRTTPQDVAERLHFLALLIADLSGAYNEYGIRRWFKRNRATLGGRSPGDVLGPRFELDGADAERLRRLAGSLTAAGAT